MKHYPKLLAIGLASAILFTACGTNSAGAITNQTPDAAPEFLPLIMGEAPITTMTSPQYPEAIRAGIILYDKTDNIAYDLADKADDGINAGDFTVYANHEYELTLKLHSDGDDIENIRVNAQLPEVLGGESSIIVYFSASDNSTSQQLMIARIFLVAYKETLELQLNDATDPLLDDGVLIESVSNTPIEVSFSFHIS